MKLVLLVRNHNLDELLQQVLNNYLIDVDQNLARMLRITLWDSLGLVTLPVLLDRSGFRYMADSMAHWRKAQERLGGGPSWLGHPARRLGAPFVVARRSCGPKKGPGCWSTSPFVSLEKSPHGPWTNGLVLCTCFSEQVFHNVPSRFW